MEARGHHMQYKAKDAYSSDDKKLGHILETDDDTFLVQHGLVFSKHFYLPTHLLVSSDADRAFLTITEGEAKALAREELPAAGDAWYGPGDDRVETPPAVPRAIADVPEPSASPIDDRIGTPVPDIGTPLAKGTEVR